MTVGSLVQTTASMTCLGVPLFFFFFKYSCFCDTITKCTISMHLESWTKQSSWSADAWKYLDPTSGHQSINSNHNDLTPFTLTVKHRPMCTIISDIVKYIASAWSHISIVHLWQQNKQTYLQSLLRNNHHWKMCSGWSFPSRKCYAFTLRCY